MAGKLGQQIQQARPIQRTTRTERVIMQQKEIASQQRFNALKQQAQSLSQSFSGLTIDEYSQEYSKLSPDLQQFFATPNELRQQAEAVKQNEKIRLQATISQLQEKKREQEQLKQQLITDFQNLPNRLSSQESYRQDYFRSLDNYSNYIEEYENQIRYITQNAGKIDEGASSDDIISYAEERASYERTRRTTRDTARYEFNKQIKTGVLDTDLATLGLNKAEVTFGDYEKAVGKYQENLSDIQRYQSWAEKVGFANISEYAKQKLNPSAIAFQKEYPNEILQFDSKGNVVSITSERYKGTFSIDEYNLKVSKEMEYNKKLEVEQKKQEQKQIEAIAYVQEKEFAKDVVVATPPETTWQKVWRGIKAGYLSTPFGYTYSAVGETKADELRMIRAGSIIKAITPSINYKKFSSPFVISYPNLTKYMTIPYETSYEALGEQRVLDYENKVLGKELENLQTLSAGVGGNLKPYVEAEGLRILETKGLELTRTTTKDYDNVDEYGNIPGIETIEITDPAFERKISTAGVIAQQTWKDKDYVTFSANLVGSAGLTFARDYFVLKGAMYGIQGITSLSKLLGAGYNLEKYWKTGTFTGKGIISSSQSYKTVKLLEGYAIVPRTYSSVKTVASVGLYGVYGYSKYKQWQSTPKDVPSQALFFAETTGSVLALESATGVMRKTYRSVKTNIDNFTLKTVKEADLSEKGFLRYNKALQGYERIYMRRYQGLKLSSPRTWLQKLQGYKLGQFTGQAKKIVSDEVTAYYKYGGDVQVYSYPKTTPVKAKVVGLRGSFDANYLDKTITTPSKLMKDIKATAFPLDEKATHYDWITRRNILEYGTGGYRKLPIKIEEYKGFVYSATSKKWIDMRFPSDVLYSKTGEPIANIKGAVRFGSGKGVSEGFLRIGRGTEESAIVKDAVSPTVYANYLKQVKINLATGELKGVTGSGMEMKFPKYTQDTGALGTGNVPLLKKEVEATYEFQKAVDIRTPFAIRRGLFGIWKVPVVEQVVGSEKELTELIKTMGLKSSAITNVGISSLPSSVSTISPAFSITRYPSKSYSVNVSRIMSRISRVSDVSNISKISATSSNVSRISRISGTSGASKISNISSVINSRISSAISEISRISTTSRITTPPRFSLPILPLSLKGKVKEKIKSKKDAKILGLFPDFTARAIGLAPKQVSVEQAMKDIRKIQTGFEVRRGAILTGMDDKKIMRSVMA